MNMGTDYTSSSLSWPVDFVCDDNSEEEACSICLEPFTSLDPSSVTKCKHEYHLHCILEWSQRRRECPVCSQDLVLKDPISQELLSGAHSVDNATSESPFDAINQDNEVNNDAPYVADSEVGQRIMQHLMSFTSRARDTSTWTTSPTIIPPHVDNSSLELDSIYPEPQSVKSVRSNSSDFAAFSESLKSKISTASIRYKQSISQSTRSLKEKLVAHSGSVKQLHARIIERIDSSHKQAAGVSAPSSSCTRVAQVSISKEKK